MKKLLLLIICLSCWIPSFSQTEINLTEEEKEEVWDFMLKTYYPIRIQMDDLYHNPEHFYEDVKIYLKNGSDTDIKTLTELSKEIGPLIPVKIYAVKDSLLANFKIDLVNAVDTTNFYRNNKPFIKNRGGFYNNEIYEQKFDLNSQKKYRQNALRNTVIIGLVAGFKYQRSHSYPTYSNYTAKVPDIYLNPSSSVIKNFYQTRSFSERNISKISKFDKYFIKQVYSDDFTVNLNSFVKEKYGYWKYLNWRSSDGLVMLKIVVFILYFLIAFVIGYKLLFVKAHNSKPKGYVLSSIYIGLIIGFSFALERKMIIYRMGIFDEREERYFTFFQIIEPYLVGVVALAILGCALYFADRVLIKTRDLFYKTILRALIQLVVSGLALMIMLSVFVLMGNSDAFEETSPIYLPIIIFFIIMTLGRSTFLYFKERNENLIREKDVKLANLSASKSEAEVASLHARINPHFLYNSLNSIASLAHLDPAKTEKMALSLSDLFKHNLNRKNESSCSLREELDAVKAYLEIEKIRFGEDLNYEIEIETGLENYLIPRNIIQPLLENAIKHGVSQHERTGLLKLHIYQSENELIIEVYDNGPDFKDGLVSGYGLQSIYDILHYTYTDKASISWENEPEKKVYISIVMEELEKVQDDI